MSPRMLCRLVTGRSKKFMLFNRLAESTGFRKSCAACSYQMALLVRIRMSTSCRPLNFRREQLQIYVYWLRRFCTAACILVARQQRTPTVSDGFESCSALTAYEGARYEHEGHVLNGNYSRHLMYGPPYANDGDARLGKVMARTTGQKSCFQNTGKT